MLYLVLSKLIWIVLLAIALILCVAYLTYAERKVIAATQLRVGPDLVGPFGLLQPIADAIKVLLKEIIIPNAASPKLFLFAPVIIFVLALVGWAVIPFGISEIDGVEVPTVIANVNLGVMYLLSVAALEVYGTIIAGWASKSSYSFLGALRSASQMISYEIVIAPVIMTVILLTGSLNLAEIVVIKHSLPYWVDILMLPMTFIFFVSILAETNRHPFDLPEAEAELVSGYNVEYSSIPFALFFLGEYANMILSSSIMATLFLGGWYPPIDWWGLSIVPGFIWFILKIVFVLFCFLIVRATLPRYRYDQLMRLCWKIFLPVTLLWIVVIGGLVAFNIV
ncbi:NADH-quinone oxidoreductase subunit NuoH [Neorickettsia risticii]|uniref:NADH-quinone oxidoreductase subunit H n=1 Tax=Neorickettsia risticii (strain Illinois) TaxID=434131 RepID=C6V3T4_NEORI|nr:NADH-quinone oxidoreductase subunit NuoH [Neorickettsia risticii]ACT69062.1 NADH-quinone oxidoreductase chain h (nadh dehydrogenasei, chain h) (ndh-1, chain h) [Neorickettsia risticii str. Illinois]